MRKAWRSWSCWIDPWLWAGRQKWISAANNASQDLLDLAAKKNVICNFTGLVIISMYHNPYS
jgi:hypothetical protein